MPTHGASSTTSWVTSQPSARSGSLIPGRSCGQTSCGISYYGITVVSMLISTCILCLPFPPALLSLQSLRRRTNITCHLLLEWRSTSHTLRGEKGMRGTGVGPMASYSMRCTHPVASVLFYDVLSSELLRIPCNIRGNIAIGIGRPRSIPMWMYSKSRGLACSLMLSWMFYQTRFPASMHCCVSQARCPRVKETTHMVVLVPESIGLLFTG